MTELTTAYKHRDPEDIWGVNNEASEELLGKYPQPFVYDGHHIRYNTEMGIHPDTPMVLDNLLVNNHLKYGHGGGSSHQHAHITGPVNYVYHPRSNSNIIYVNPISGAVKIMLGEAGNIFTPNTTVTVKDVSLHYGNGSAYNVTVAVPEGSFLEVNNKGRISVVNGGTYNLNTSGGSVTFRYVCLSGASNTWIVDHSSTGNARMAAGFRQAKPNVRQEIAGNKFY